MAADLAPSIEATYRALEGQLGAEFIEHLYITLDQLIAKLGDSHVHEDTN